MAIRAILISAVLASCSTYKRTTELPHWFDDKGFPYHVYKIEVYDRKTDKLLKTKMDTVEIDMCPTSYIP